MMAPTNTPANGTSRAGNSLVVVMGVVVLAAGILLVSTQRSSATARASSSGSYQQLALAAAEAVAARQETTIATYASGGDPASWVDLSDPKIAGNYGESWLGSCRVRWKIEPAATASVAPDGVEGWNYIVNPAPDTTTPTIKPRVGNDATYLFRIAAEATYLNGTTATSSVLARAQAVRFASVDKIPLFRYVIFYAKNGPKGDLEFSHGPGVKVRGNVHSNGAIYLGSGTQVNDYGALLQTAGSIVADSTDPMNGEYANATIIGPDQNNKNVRVTGVDGIFRLSKQTLFGSFNGFPMSGVSPAGSPSNNWYSVAAAAPGEAGAQPNYKAPNLAGSDLAAITLGGRVINPNRVTDKSALATREVNVLDQIRKINGVAIRGFTYGFLGTPDAAANTSSKANDSRDVTRTNFAWKSDSLKSTAPGTSGYARSSENGGKAVPLAKAMLARPMEAQAIIMPSYLATGARATLVDGVTPDQSYPHDNPLTSADEEENHWQALPVFVKPDGTDTCVMPASGDVVEKPGAQLRNAMGRDDTFYIRRSPFTGWDVKRVDGTAAGADPNNVGLVIRERPVPDTSLAPDLAYPTTLSPDYMPYVYGKPRPASMPFMPIDIADSMSNTEFNSDLQGPYGTNTRNTSVLIQRETYTQGGTFKFSAANRTGPGAVVSNQYGRAPAYFRGNWRMFNLKKPHTDSADTDSYSYSGASGLRASYFYNMTFTGNAHVMTNANINFNSGGGYPTPLTPAPPTPFSNNNYSVRWEGLITAPATGTFNFSTFTDDVCRIWVDGVLVLHQFRYTGGVVTGNTADSSGQPIQLELGKSYSFVCELVQGTGGAACQAYWSYPGSGGNVIIPPSAFKQPLVAGPNGATTFRKETFFHLDDFKTVQMRVEDFQNPSAPNAKVALMIQDASGGVSSAQSGRAPYAAICYSPRRGFFIEYRGLPATEKTVTATLYYIGGGTENGLPAPAGQVTTATGVPTVRSGTMTLFINNPDATAANSSGTQIKDDKWQSTDPHAMNSPWSTPEGTVNRVMLGPVAKTWRKTPQAYNRSQRGRASEWTVAGLDASGAFTGNDTNSNISLYSTTTGGPAVDAVPASWNYNPVTNRIARTETNYTASNGNYWNPWQTWGTVISLTDTQGDNKTIYPPYPAYYNGGTYVRDATAAETLTYMNANYGGGYQIATAADYPTYLDPGTPVFNPGLPPNTDAALPGSHLAGTMTFSIPRTVTPTIDLNSYVSSWCPWFATAQPQWVPYLNGYTNWAQTGVTSAIIPTANSFRPDSYFNSTWNPLSPPTVGPTDGSAVQSVVSSPRWLDDAPAALPAAISATNQVWLRMERVGITSRVRFLYYVGPPPVAPATVPASFTPMTNASGVTIEFDLASFGGGMTYAPASLNSTASSVTDRQVFIGPAVQSGNVNFPAEVTVSSIKLETNLSAVSGLDVWDATKWEGNGATGPTDMSRYMASQYQVFFGSQDITEDFFTYNQADAARRLATEDWIYNTREFWSQSKWWDGNLGRLYFKESTSQGSSEPNFLPSGGVSHRELASKMTMLTVNMREVQDYLKTRTIPQALTKTISLGATPPAGGTILASKFNKLIYLVRTNRYPVNPLPGSSNPWNSALPNTSNDMTDLGTASDAAVKAMQPYALPYAPALRSQQFFQGVRIVQGSVIDWEYPASGPAPDFGNSKLSIITPNQLLIQGDFNYNAAAGGAYRTVKYKGVDDTTHPVPVAIMGDAVTFLSNNFSDDVFKVPGLTTAADGSAVTSGGTLAYGSASAIPVATNTSYYCSIVTNNQPTSRDSVMNGEAASFINAMVHLENWNGVRMSYSGSLVVLDTRRYANHYLLDAPKNYGWGPFGFHLTTTASSSWPTTWGVSFSSNTYDNPRMQISNVQGAPKRALTFNYDLLTEAGTPPFVPFGVSVAGRGGWTKIIE